MKKAPQKVSAEKIRKVLRKYFEAHTDGTPSETFDPCFEPQAAIDEIAAIVEKW